MMFHSGGFLGDTEMSCHFEAVSTIITINYVCVVDGTLLYSFKITLKDTAHAKINDWRGLFYCLMETISSDLPSDLSSGLLSHQMQAIDSECNT